MKAITLSRIVGPRFKADRSARLIWAAVAGACSAVLVIAACLKPDGRGYGTHEALGLGPCSTVLVTGLPCPTCGMTTAFSNAVRGRLLTAFIAQPAGLIFFLATVAIMVYGLHVSIRGWTYFINWDQIAVRVMMVLGLLIVAGWGFKIGHGLLTGLLPVG